MALQNHPALYTGGNTRMDMTPYMNVVLRQRALKQAKDEALNQYYTKLPQSLNTAGVRKQDLQGEHGGILNDLDKTKRFWLQNKEQIKQGGIKQQEYTSMMQDIQSKIEESKMEGKKEIMLGKAKFEGKFTPRHDDIPIIEKISKSIYDPSGYKEDGVTRYDENDLSGSVPRYDVNKQKQFEALTTGLMKPVYLEDKARIDNTTGKVFVPLAYDKKSIDAAAKNAANAIQSDKSARYHYEDLLEDEEFVARATKAFQEFYNTSELVDTPEKAAMADKIGRMVASAGEKEITDPNYAQKLRIQLSDRKYNQGLAKQTRGFRQQERMAYLNDKLAKGRIAFKSATSTGEQVNVLNTFWENQQGNGSNKFSKIRIGGVEYQGKMVDIPKKLADKYVVKVDEVWADGKVYEVDKAPIGFYQTKDQIIPIYTTGRKTKSGNMEINATISKPESKQNYLLGISEIMLPQKERSLATDTEEEVFISEDAIETGVPTTAPRQGTSTPKQQTPKQSKPQSNSKPKPAGW